MAGEIDNYRLYLDHALEMIEVARENLGNDRYSSACNRAYYGCFYAASALIYSKGLSFGKHSAVISAFRQHFVRTGEFDAKWSRIYELVMNTRQVSDYELSVEIEKEQAEEIVSAAAEFIAEVQTWLQSHNYL